MRSEGLHMVQTKCMVWMMVMPTKRCIIILHCKLWWGCWLIMAYRPQGGSCVYRDGRRRCFSIGWEVDGCVILYIILLYCWYFSFSFILFVSRRRTVNVAEFQLIIINRLIVVFNSDSNGVKFVGFDYDVTFIGAMTRASKCSNWRRFWPPCWHSNPRPSWGDWQNCRFRGWIYSQWIEEIKCLRMVVSVSSLGHEKRR